MKSSIFVLLSFLCFNLFAQDIYDIDYGKDHEEAMILLTNGKVVFTKDKKSLRGIKIQKSNFIQKNDFFMRPQSESTLIEGMEAATKLFQEARTNSKKSECFNRAHVWSYEWFKNNLVFSEKIWIFFSRKYIRKYKFDWWFHVAPLFRVKEGEQILDRVMDIKYLSGPQNISRWSDYFMRNKATCLEVQKYSDYANYPESAWCHIMRTDMFAYQPVDLEWEEIYGTKKSNWDETELATAFKDALDEQF